MQLDLRGHPLHSRSLSCTLSQRADGRLDGRAVLLDLRKRGIVPVGGDLGTPGVVHHMALDAIIDPAEPRLVALAARQFDVAFEPSAFTGGESCRDPIAALDGLVGARLDPGFARRLSTAFGGAGGCSHILTLAHVLSAATTWALRPAGGTGIDLGRRAGERLFRRDITIDGSQRADGALDLGAQLTDVYFAAAPPVARPMDRFTAVHEVRVSAPVAMPAVTFGALRAAERRRERETIEQTAWVDRSARLAGLRGLSLFRGVSAQLIAHLGAGEAERPLLDASLMLAPTFIQVCGALSDAWLGRAMAADSLIGMGGLPDSCYMWRRGGALDRRRRAEDPVPSF